MSLLDLFDGRAQLIVYRAFLEPGVHGWPDHACVGCSMVADQVAHVAHLNARDTTLVFASRAPQPDIDAREGADGLGDAVVHDDSTSFDNDFGVDEWHGTNVFIRDGDRCTAPTSSTTAATSRWAAPGTTSTSPRSGVRRSGRTRPRATRRTTPYEWWIWHDEPEGDGHRPGAEQLEIAKQSGLEHVQT